MHLGITKRNTKKNTYNFDNIKRNYNGGLFSYMKLAREHHKMDKSIITEMSKFRITFWEYFMYVKCFFKSTLWIFHKETRYVGQIILTETVDKTPEGVVVASSKSRTYSKDIKRVTYFIFRAIPIFHYRKELTSLSDEEVSELTK